MISNSKMQMYISLNPSKFKRIATVVTMGQKKIVYVLWEEIRQGFDNHSDIFLIARLHKLCILNKGL